MVRKRNVVATETVAVPKRKFERRVSGGLASPGAQLALAVANGFGAYACLRAVKTARVPIIYIFSGIILGMFTTYHLYKTVSPKQYVY